MEMDQVHHLEQLETLSWQLRNLRGDLKNARIEVDTLHGELTERARLDRVLLAPHLQLTRLAPLAPAKGASAVVAVSSATGNAVIRAFGLPETPPGKTYELWWITKERGPIGASTFDSQSRRTAVSPVCCRPSASARCLPQSRWNLPAGTLQTHRPDVPEGAPEWEESRRTSFCPPYPSPNAG